LKQFKVPAVVGFMDQLVLFEIDNFHIDLGQPDLQVNPDRDDDRKETEQGDGLREGEAEKGGFGGSLGWRCKMNIEY